MEHESRNKLNAAAQKAAAAAAQKARTATGWKKWLWFIIAAAAGVVMVFTMTGCLADYTQTPDATSFQIAVLPLRK